MHRPIIDWEKAELRHQHGSVEQRIFDGLKKMIEVENPHLFVFWLTDQ